MLQTRGRIISGGLAACLVLATPLIKVSEGYSAATYLDAVRIPTECYGHTGADVKMGTVRTRDECLAILQKDEAADVEGVLSCVHVDLQPWEAAALTSFVHNVGAGALCGSTVAKLANAGASPLEWCYHLKDWTYAHKGGVAVQLPGLVTRRNAEYNLCIGNPAPKPAG